MNARAVSILDELEESDPNDPRVKALANIIGRTRDDDETSAEILEVALTKPSTKRSRRWIDDAPLIQ